MVAKDVVTLTPSPRRMSHSKPHHSISKSQCGEPARVKPYSCWSDDEEAAGLVYGPWPSLTYIPLFGAPGHNTEAEDTRTCPQPVLTASELRRCTSSMRPEGPSGPRPPEGPALNLPSALGSPTNGNTGMSGLTSAVLVQTGVRKELALGQNGYRSQVPAHGLPEG